MRKTKMKSMNWNITNTKKKRKGGKKVQNRRRKHKTHKKPAAGNLRRAVLLRFQYYQYYQGILYLSTYYYQPGFCFKALLRSTTVCGKGRSSCLPTWKPAPLLLNVEPASTLTTALCSEA